MHRLFNTYIRYYYLYWILDKLYMSWQIIQYIWCKETFFVYFYYLKNELLYCYLKKPKVHPVSILGFYVSWQNKKGLVFTRFKHCSNLTWSVLKHTTDSIILINLLNKTKIKCKRTKQKKNEVLFCCRFRSWSNALINELSAKHKKLLHFCCSLI